MGAIWERVILAAIPYIVSFLFKYLDKWVGGDPTKQSVVDAARAAIGDHVAQQKELVCKKTLFGKEKCQ